MSGYHHYEGSNCAGCYAGKWNMDYATDYGQKSNDQCLPHCMDRFENERSTRDQMDYQFYVKNETSSKPGPIRWPKSTLPGQVENYKRK